MIECDYSPITPEEVAYGALWRLITDDQTVVAARRIMLEKIGGKNSPGQRRAVEWAALALPAVSESEISSITTPASALAAPRPMPGREEVGETVYRALYEHQGGDWRAVETREVWFKIGDAILSLFSASLGGREEVASAAGGLHE